MNTEWTSRRGRNGSGVARGRHLVRIEMRALVTCLLLMLGMACAAQPQAPEPLVGTVPETDLVITVTEGPGEPRSIGSYALRLYAPYDPAWPYDAFASGVVRARDGAVESIRFEDVDGDEMADVTVVVRSTGSGGYLSADAYRLVEGRVSAIARVVGLARDADPVSALRDVAKSESVGCENHAPIGVRAIVKSKSLYMDSSRIGRDDSDGTDERCDCGCISGL